MYLFFGKLATTSCTCCTLSPASQKGSSFLHQYILPHYSASAILYSTYVGTSQFNQHQPDLFIRSIEYSFLDGCSSSEQSSPASVNSSDSSNNRPFESAIVIKGISPSQPVLSQISLNPHYTFLYRIRLYLLFELSLSAWHMSWVLQPTSAGETFQPFFPHSSAAAKPCMPFPCPLP